MSKPAPSVLRLRPTFAEIFLLAIIEPVLSTYFVSNNDFGLIVKLPPLVNGLFRAQIAFSRDVTSRVTPE
jgi:hypothetical protein